MTATTTYPWRTGEWRRLETWQQALADARVRRLLYMGLGAILAIALASRPTSLGGVGRPLPWPLLGGFFGDPQAGIVIRAIGAVGLGLLVVSWAYALRLVHLGVLGLRQTALIAGLWAVALFLLPPILSSDVYSYTAHSMMILQGGDVYTQTPAQVIPSTPELAATDPRWSDTVSPYGPLWTVVEGFAGLLGLGMGPLIEVVFRLISTASAVVAVGVVVAAVRPEHRAWALALVGLNPIILLHFVGGVHQDAMMMALAVAGVALADRRPRTAVALATAGAMIKITAGFAAAAIVFYHVRRAPQGERMATFVRLAAVGAAVVGVLLLLVPSGWRSLLALGTPGSITDAMAPTFLVSALLSGLGLGSMDTVLPLVRDLGLLTAAGYGAYLLATAERRSVWRTAGMGLVGLVALSPVIHPWYVTWGILLLVPVSIRNRPMTIGIMGVSLLLVFKSLPSAAYWAMGFLFVAVVVAGLAWVLGMWGKSSPARLDVREAFAAPPLEVAV
jgi:hypothetical protein